MKKLLVLFLSLLLILSMAIPGFAAEQPQPVLTEVTVLGDGIVVTDRVFETTTTTARANYLTQVRERTVTRNNVIIAELAFEAIYNYDGTTVYVVAKHILQTDAYDGWTYTKESFTSSGGTVTLAGTLSKWLGSVDATMTLTCDKDGNITYT